MKRLAASDVHARKVVELGLDPTAVDLTSVEAIAGALRRAASFLCPCAAATLVRSVARPLRGLVGDLKEVKSLIEETLEAMIAHGDFIECNEVAEDPAYGSGALLYAGPASFVARQSGAAILLGIASDQLSALPGDLETRIEYLNHIRRLSPEMDEDLRSRLAALGLIELSYEGWLKPPAAEDPARHVAKMNSLLDAAQPSRDIPGLLLLDPERSVDFYPKRWVEPRLQTGCFVGRRSQAYGAALWCYVQLNNGHPERLVDLPVAGSRWRGCDEAWRLQMAIDAHRGEPQRFRVRPTWKNTVAIEFFSPLPMWARRRWDAVGEPVLSSGCLFAYRLAENELEEELRYIREALWLEELCGSGRSG